VSLTPTRRRPLLSGYRTSMMQRMAQSMGEKVKENRVRQAAKRKDLALVKSRAKDPGDFTYGTYQLTDVRTGAVMYADPQSPRGYGLTLDEAEAAIATHTRR
jgi:hypothetical protein